MTVAVTRRKPENPKNRRATAREDEFIQAALELFSERGVGIVTIKDIATAVGVNPALIYYYFENKDDLVKRTIETYISKFYAQFKQISDPKKPATCLIEWLRLHVLLYDEISKVTKISADYRSPGNARGHVNEYITQYLGSEKHILSKAISDGMKTNLFQKVDADRVAEFIVIHLDGTMIRSNYVPDFDPAAAIEDLTTVMWQILGYQDDRALKKRGRK
jgi:AcrR family transcriptional regulator